MVKLIKATKEDLLEYSKTTGPKKSIHSSFKSYMMIENGIHPDEPDYMVDLSRIDFDANRFGDQDVDFSNLNLSDCYFCNSSFSGHEFNNTKFDNSIIIGSNFNNSKFEGASALNCSIFFSNFDMANGNFIIDKTSSFYFNFNQSLIKFDHTYFDSIKNTFKGLFGKAENIVLEVVKSPLKLQDFAKQVAVGAEGAANGYLFTKIISSILLPSILPSTPNSFLEKAIDMLSIIGAIQGCKLYMNPEKSFFEKFATNLTESWRLKKFDTDLSKDAVLKALKEKEYEIMGEVVLKKCSEYHNAIIIKESEGELINTEEIAIPPVEEIYIPQNEEIKEDEEWVIVDQEEDIIDLVAVEADILNIVE